MIISVYISFSDSSCKACLFSSSSATIFCTTSRISAPRQFCTSFISEKAELEFLRNHGTSACRRFLGLVSVSLAASYIDSFGSSTQLLSSFASLIRAIPSSGVTPNKSNAFSLTSMYSSLLHGKCSDSHRSSHPVFKIRLTDDCFLHLWRRFLSKHLKKRHHRFSLFPDAPSCALLHVPEKPHPKVGAL